MVIMDTAHGGCADIVRQAIMVAARVMGVKNATVEVLIVGDVFMKKNVLAYPAPLNFPRPDLGKKRDLGEIYINPGYIAQHNEDARRMTIHGFLHLLGYDHTAEHDTLIMEEKEHAIMRAVARAHI